MNAGIGVIFDTWWTHVLTWYYWFYIIVISFVPIHTGLWDSLLEARIKLQKVLSSTNQMPQHDTIEDFVESGGVEVEEALSKGKKDILYIA